MELQIAEGNRYLGNGQQALSNVAQFGALAPERIDDIMGQVHDLQTARVLADRSRREAERLATAMAAVFYALLFFDFSEFFKCLFH